jgi:nucleoside 2-deoxyribosyltransferase
MTRISNLSYYISIPPSKDYEPIIKLIQHSIKELGLQRNLRSIQTSLHGGAISESVKEVIKHSDFIIADLTGYNPNVMYEVGYAHALKIPVLLIIQSNFKKVPSNIGGYLFFVYNTADLKNAELFDILKDEIKKWITSQFEEKFTQDSGS